MQHQISNSIDPNKVFLVNRSETKGRLDPKMALYNKRVQNSLFPMVKLKNMLLSKPQYGANEAGLDRSNNSQPRYIRITDIDENGLISINELGVTVANVEEKYILKENDILIARSGATVGKAYIHKELPYTCLYAGYLIRFIVDSNKILPGYLFSYTQLNTYKEWVSAIQRPSGQPNINAEEYQSLEIPLPDISVQSIITNIIRDAYSLKCQKDLEAQQLLDDIDSYLLEELAITLPGIKTDLKSRQFFINRSALEGRFDPSVYKDGVKLVSEKYDNVKLSSCAWINPHTSFRGMDPDTLISFIPMEVIDECYCEVTSLLKKPIADSSGFTKFQNDDLLWAKITPCMQNGKSVVARGLTNGLGCGSTEFFVIRPRTNQLYIDYLQALLHMKAIRRTAMLYFGGSAGQQRVSINYIENFNVPLPPKEKQEEIVAHISQMRARAKKLQAEGAEILQKAKLEVERMILG
ncbi:MAG: restriction endonuclease subunit S [Paludibacteraceae bacterium]|nr:restriction endonuclease subunit S [Paludibacteraceae bacterium]